MVVTGTWTPSDGSGAVTFETYFDADIEVELDIMNPVLEITDAGANRELIVLLNPASWFLNGGVVMNLKALEGQLVDFDLEIEGGFELEID